MGILPISASFLRIRVVSLHKGRFSHHSLLDILVVNRDNVVC